jgi:hypothetical protein
MARAHVLSGGDMTRLFWTSADRQGSIPMGEYNSSELAHAAIEACRAELLEQGADGAAIEAGMWEVVDDPQECLPYLIIDTDRGCPHACAEQTVRVTDLYLATQMICPRNCIDPVVDIYWRPA